MCNVPDRLVQQKCGTFQKYSITCKAFTFYFMHICMWWLLCLSFATHHTLTAFWPWPSLLVLVCVCTISRLHSTQYFTCIQPPGVGVATTAVFKDKGHSFPLSGLSWHVLNEIQPPLEADHGLIDGNLLTKVVCSHVLVEHVLNLYSGSCQGCPLGTYFMLSLRWRKWRSRDNRSRRSKVSFCWPCVFDLWEHNKSHHNHRQGISSASAQRGCVVFSPMLKPLRSKTSLWHQYTAERSG